MTLVRSVWHGRKVKEAERRGAVKGLTKWCEDVMQQSANIVPIEDKGLLDSRNLVVDESSLLGAVYYDTPYAVRQHEELDYQHDEGKQAKYLETPLIMRESVGKKLVADEIKKETGG